MARVKRAVNAQKKRRTVLKASKGYRGQRSRLYRKAKEQQLHSLTYAYRDRQGAQGRLPQVVDHPHQCRGPRQRHHLQPADPGPQGRRCRGRPQEPRRDRCQRSGCVHRTGRGRQGRAARGCQRARRARLPDSTTLTERSARVAAAVKLHRHVGRRRAARFLAEGPNLVEAALRRGLVSEVFATESAAAPIRGLLVGAPVHLVTERAAKALSDTVTPVGLVAVCSMPDAALADVLARTPRLVAVAVGTSEPGNAGTLIRLADAMGADAVVLAGNSVDPYNGKCLRASAGSIFALPVLEATRRRGAVTVARQAGLQITGHHPRRRVEPRRRGPVRPTAWLFGSEAHGLRARGRRARPTNACVIPMAGGAESLNVAAAAAICLYQSSAARSDAASVANHLRVVPFKDCSRIQHQFAKGAGACQFLCEFLEADRIRPNCRLCGVFVAAGV